MSKINDLLEYSITSGASDLHLSVGSIPMVRIHGEMKKLQLPKMNLDTMLKIKKDLNHSVHSDDYWPVFF